MEKDYTLSLGILRGGFGDSRYVGSRGKRGMVKPVLGTDVRGGFNEMQDI